MTLRLDKRMMLAALSGMVCVASCAQLPVTQCNDAPAPRVLPKGVFTTATESTTIIDDSTLKKDGDPNPLTAPAKKTELKLDMPPGNGSPPPANIQQPPVIPLGPQEPPTKLPMPSPVPSVPKAEPTSLSPPPSQARQVQVQTGTVDNTLRGPTREPVVDALEALVAGRQQEYRMLLEKYDPATREVFERFLPLLARLAQKPDPLQSPGSDPASRLPEANSLIQFLLPKTELVIDNVCFCEWIKAFGNYQPVPDMHVFRAATANRKGEEIQLYVELRNFASIKVDGFYETRLASFAEIRDSKDNKLCWSSDFDGKEQVISSRSLLHDFNNKYSFRLPALPQGNYILTIRVIDQTRTNAPREKSKSIPFRVGSSQRSD